MAGRGALTPSAGAWAVGPWLTVTLFLVPVIAGLAGTLLPAFGYLPALGGQQLSLAPWRALARQPGIATSIALSLQIGVLATALSLLFASAFCAAASERRLYQKLSRLLAPMLATPHVAVAIGLAFLIAPSGWLVRLVSPWLTGWDRPPGELVIVRDPQGLAMVIGLVLKEVPYLVLMITAALNQVPHAELRRSAAALGYPTLAGWFKVVFPRVYPQLRLPVYAVLAFSASNVEVGLILAPGNPPPLAVLAARWFADYDLQRYFPAAAAAVLQALLVLLVLCLWRVCEGVVASLGRRWCEAGRRDDAARLGPIASAAGTAALLVGMPALTGMAIWSFALDWRFPELLPAHWTLSNWETQWPRVAPSVRTTLSLAVASSAVAVLLTIACLESETRRSRTPGAGALWMVYVPLLVPQIAFLYGFQTVLVCLGLDGRWLAVAWAHLVFVLPYAFLSLADPWRALDRRYPRSAASLGARPWTVLWRVRLPMLARPLLVTFAVGCAVSVGLYLPTLFAGAGRVATLTTDAVTLSSGADRRVIGVYAFLQSAIPLLLYAAALVAPALLFRSRRGMS